MKKLESILVGIDFSDYCVSALKEAGRLAQRDGATLHVMHTMSNEFVEQYREHFTIPVTEVINQIRQEVTAFAEMHLDPSVLFESQVVVGHAVAQLVQAATDFSADLLVSAHTGGVTVARIASG